MPGVGLLVLAAGKGTRMRSRLPKVLHGAGGRSLLANVLAAATGAGFAPAAIAVVVGYEADAIRASLASWIAQGLTMIEQVPQQGTGHAVMVAETWWRNFERVVVVHGDMPLVSSATVRSLAEGTATAVLATAAPDEPRSYGRILRDPLHPERIVGIVEEKQASAEQKQIRELNAGFYGFATAALAPALRKLGTANPHGEYYLTDTIALLAGQDLEVRSLPLADADECLGVNDRAELAQIDRLLRGRKVRVLLEQGVTIEFPETVVVDADVEVGQDTRIEAGVQLRGATRVGANCHLQAYSVLTDCQLADAVRVRPHSVLESAKVGTAAQLGPFTRLREGADIGPEAHVGNFVEVKKSRIGKGSKANHLAYIGDATVGAGANIGAGTITCNYDGRLKHPTTIGDRTFIGSNSTLVAPITLGDGAYVAAGSVLTDAVPADSLALGRARQVIKTGWAKRRRDSQPR